MKTKKFALMMLLLTLVAVFGLTRHQATAQTIASGNLFNNPGFEAGYFNQDNIPQIAVPNGWRMHWLDNVPFDGTDGLPAYRPETVVWFIKDAPVAEQTVFFRDGSYTLKVFKGWAPMYAALSQDVSGLEVGRKYRLSIPIFIDIVESYDGGKQAPARKDSGFVRFGVGAVGAPWLDASQIHYSPYWTAENINPFYLTMPIFVWDFTATHEAMTIFIEMGSRHPYQNNGFFMDGVGLYALDVLDTSVPGSGGGAPAAPVAQSGPTATPFPTPTPRADGAIIHVVNTGDSFWSIAIQYAPALELTPEEALPVIQELNNNPAFLTVGQELLIKEADPNAPLVAEAPAADETETLNEEGAGSEEVIVVEGDAEAEVAAATTTETTDAQLEEGEAEVASICVTAFDDLNGDGLRDADTERLQADAAITLFQGGSTVSTYISDGISEPYCFENLAPDTYQVQIFPPANYQTTTASSWAVALSGGVVIPVEFGTQFLVPDTTDVSDSEASDAAAVETADLAAATDALAADRESGGFFSSVGNIILVVAVVLILLAVAGVVMLRRA
jgi:hypothetical protein